ncbi:MAG: hypothetical protein IIW01_09000 [Thermoguttaceae bacterium]|nr:hypothetical protein [Thermoguttaceae bacterium]
MLTRKALVDHAIQFKNPERVPVWVDGDNIGLSDILTTTYPFRTRTTRR